MKLSDHEDNQIISGQYKISAETFRVFCFEKPMKRVSIYKVDLKNKKVSLPQYLNVDFIQEKIDHLNAMLIVSQNLESAKKKENVVEFEENNTTDISNMNLKKFLKVDGKKNKEQSERFKIQILSMNNMYYDRELFIIFDGFNLHKFIEEDE